MIGENVESLNPPRVTSLGRLFVRVVITHSPACELIGVCAVVLYVLSLRTACSTAMRRRSTNTTRRAPVSTGATMFLVSIPQPIQHESAHDRHAVPTANHCHIRMLDRVRTLASGATAPDQYTGRPPPPRRTQTRRTLAHPPPRHPHARVPFSPIHTTAGLRSQTHTRRGNAALCAPQEVRRRAGPQAAAKVLYAGAVALWVT